MPVPLRRSRDAPRPSRKPPRSLVAARRVALVCMPFADPRYPSVALATLAEAARERGHRVDVHHFHLEAAARIGLRRYYNLQGGTSWYNLIGEWLLSHPDVTPGAASEAEMRRHLGPFSGRLEIDMGYFASHRAARTTTDLFDAMELGPLRGELDQLVDEWFERIDWGSYDVVGFSVVFQQLNASLRLARRIKDSHPRVKVVLGGAALEPPMGDAIAERWPFIDAVFSGFADVSFPSWLQNLSSDDPIITHQGDPIVLDELPIPNYDDYFDALARTGLSRRLEPRVPLETSRGCWWGEKRHCTFCGFNANEMWFRQKSAARAYAELESLSRYGEPLYVVDNIVPMDYFTELFPRLVEEGFRFPGGFVFTKSNLRRDQLELLAKAGLSWIQPGIESLSTSVLSTMQKGVSGVHNVWFLRASEEAGIHPVWAILYGFPQEDPAAYADMDSLLPALSHLPAPTGAYRILMARYSPIHRDREALGLTDVQPARAYTLAFGDHARLADQAYTFDYRYASGADPDSYAGALATASKRWASLRQLPLAPRCEVFHVGGRRLLFDSRRLGRIGRARPRLSWLSKAEWTVLEALESPVPEKRFAARLESAPFDAQGVLRELLERELVLARDGRLVRLVVLRKDPRPASELLRVAKDKLRQLRFGGVWVQQQRAAAKQEALELLSALLRTPKRLRRSSSPPEPMR